MLHSLFLLVGQEKNDVYMHFFLLSNRKKDCIYADRFWNSFLNWHNAWIILVLCYRITKQHRLYTYHWCGILNPMPLAIPVKYPLKNSATEAVSKIIASLSYKMEIFWKLCLALKMVLLHANIFNFVGHHRIFTKTDCNVSAFTLLP